MFGLMDECVILDRQKIRPDRCGPDDQGSEKTLSVL